MSNSIDGEYILTNARYANFECGDWTKLKPVCTFANCFQEIFEKISGNYAQCSWIDLWSSLRSFGIEMNCIIHQFLWENAQ